MPPAARPARRARVSAPALPAWGAELALLVVFLGSGFAACAMAGFSPSDPTLFTPGEGRVENPCGPVGALIAAGLHLGFGFGGWAVIVPGTMAGLGLAGRRVRRWGRWVGAGALWLDTLGLLELAMPENPVFPAGGQIGRSLALGLVETVGVVGAWLVIGGFAAMLVTGIAEIRWANLARELVDLLERAWPYVRAGTLWSADLAGRGAVAGGRGGLFVGTRLAVGTWHVAQNGASAARVLPGVVAGAGGQLQDGVARLGDGLRRASDSFRRRDPEDEPSLIEIDDPEDEDEDYDGLDASDGVPEPSTAPGGPPLLAEVEWEPTVELRNNREILGMFPDLPPRDRRPGSTPRAAPLATPPQAEQVLPPMLFDDGDVVVHHNHLLDERFEDDGGAVVAVAPREFLLPTLSLLDEVPEQKAVFDEDDLRRLASMLEEKLLSFKIGGRIVGVRPGPVVTIFEFLPDAGVKVSRITSLADDLAMALKAVSVRIVAPVPGKGVVGIEIPSPKRLTIFLREMLASPEFRDPRALPCVLGKDTEGRPMIADLASMPHLLVGGTTGSGKSVGVNGMLMSLLFTRTPDELRMLLVDPKKLEFELYHGIPHLLHPVVTEAKEAAAALAWACREMDDRYGVLARWGVRNIVGFNQKVERELEDWTPEKARQYAPKGWTELDGPLAMPKKLPYIVIVIDELADLMMVAGKDVEESICRIAQKARACGIHLIAATQRPSVDVVTGLIKANLPTRIAYQLRTRTDSRTILDQMGAESLLGKGDLLYLPPGVGNLVRVHGAFVSDDEVSRVANHLRAQRPTDYVVGVTAGAKEGEAAEPVERDEMFEAAVEVCIEAGKASTSLVQRHLKIGYNRAANLIEQMEKAGIVGPADGARPREVLVRSMDEV